MSFFQTHREKYQAYRSAHFGKRNDSYIRRFSLYQDIGRKVEHERINDSALLEAALNEPVGYRLVFIVGRDTVNCGFDIVKENNRDIHRYNDSVQSRFEEFNLNQTAVYAYQLERLYGRSWLVKIDPTEHDKVKGEKVFYTAFSNPDLAAGQKHTWDENREFIPVKFNLRFTENLSKIPIEVQPEDYYFLLTRPIDQSDNGLPVLQPCWNDLMNLHIMRKAFTERVKKYGGFPHIKVIGANDTVLQNAQEKWGDFDELKEAWSNEETEIDMKGLEGVQLDPNKFLEPYIRQVSISSGYPMPILMGMESGQLKSGQINMSSVYALIYNNQESLKGMGEWMARSVQPNLANFNIRWRLEYAISDIDKLSMRQIEIDNAIKLRPYITDDAFARMLGIDVKDLRKEPPQTQFGFNKPFPPQNSIKYKNFITEDVGRNFGDKKDKKLRSQG